MSRHWKIKDWFPTLEATIQDNLLKFNDEILRFNPTLNLVSNNASGQLESEHFFDSIAGLKFVMSEFKGSTVFDFGSGNGFPGVIGAICYPEASWNLVESDIRKSEFLKYCGNSLGLKNLSVLNKRVESLADGSVDFAIARGFAPLDKSMLITSKVFSNTGSFFHFKGPSWSKELTKVPPQVFSKWQVIERESYTLPDSNVERFIIETKRI